MSNALATLAVYKKKEDRGSLEVLSGWEGKWGDRDGMLAIATGSEVESSSLFFFIACFTFALAVERDKQCVIFLGCFMTFY